MSNIEQFYDCFSDMTKEISSTIIVNFFVYLTNSENLCYQEANKILSESSTIYFKKSVEFMNIFWKNYHTNYDKVLVNKINEIKNHGFIVHNSCLFQFLLSHICAFINGFLQNNINFKPNVDLDIPMFKKYAEYVFDVLDADFKNQFISQELRPCGDHCKYVGYDENTPFVVLKSENN